MGGGVGDGCAVRRRAVEPMEGLGSMAGRRGREQDLASGPGRVGQAFGVTDALDMHDFSSAPLRLLPGWSIPPGSVDVSPRVGVSTAQDWPRTADVVRGRGRLERSERVGRAQVRESKRRRGRRERQEQKSK